MFCYNNDTFFDFHEYLLDYLSKSFYYYLEKSFDNIDPRVRSVYEKIPPIVLKTDLVESPKSIKLEYYKKSSQSTILHCSNKPYTYQELSLDDIKDIYTATLSNQNEVEVNNLVNFLF
jgi:hypothetical protein